MAEKDITEKILADYNDVFADIMNVFLFHGRQVVSPDDLETTKDKSQYKADGKIHEQERDVSKLLKKNHLVISIIGFEHQTKPEKFLPVRLFSYDGQSYRKQLLAKNTQRVYPVITLVLYFGLKPWKYSRRLMDLIDAPGIFKPFISDYEMKNLFPVAFLEPEQVQWFQSDFRYVADYFVQMRLKGDYTPSPDTIEHVDETLKLMAVLTGDHRFEDVIPEVKKEGGHTMCTVVDRVENKGREEGRTEGIQIGEERGKLSGKIEVYYTELGLTPEQIAEKTNLNLETVLRIIKNLNS